jgi:hypothetical protein
VWKPGVRYDLLIAPQIAQGSIVRLNDGSVVANTEDDTLYHASIRGGTHSFTVHIDGLPAGKAKVSLYFADLSEGRPHRHDFDIEINHQVVAKKFDIVTAAGGGSTAVIKTFTVDTVNGAIDFGPGIVYGPGEALFNAVKIEVGGKTFAYVLGGEKYTDKSGLVWQPYLPPNSALTPALIDEVKAGTPILVIAPSDSTGGTAASLLAATGAFHYTNTIPTQRAAWMGDWIFVRQSPLFDGLPQNEVMKGDYQPVLHGAYGLQVDGPGVDIWAGYGRDHSRSLGASIFTAKLGKGTILFDGMAGEAPLVEQRLLANFITYLRTQPKD